VSDVQVLDRAVILLRVISESRGPVALADIAARSGLPRSTCRRILAALSEHRLCEHHSGGTYALGLQLFEWGTLVGARLEVRDVARPELEALAETTDLTAFLCVRDADRAVCIDRVDGRFAHSLALRLGGSIPLHVGAAPRALLALSGDPSIGRYLQSANLVALTERTVTTPEGILRDLELVRERGWSFSDGDVSQGTASVGAPVFNHAGDVVAAVSVSGLTPHVTGDRLDALSARVVETSRAISVRLGHEGRSDLVGAGT
jgi:DNA-binding IclR family transcriptional regulator